MISGSTISHYRIVEKLGEGGMGVVYKAEDTKLHRQVALKFLAQHLLDDPEAKERFLREAQAAAALHHANICPVYEIDEVDTKTFISMAYVEGETLEDKIARGPLAIKEALEIGQQIAKGLQAAHEKAIVHRDIKPANVLVATDGQVTIMDFGLARLTEASRLTKVDTAMGTVAYMSPEQAQGIEVDHRSDVWSLGCVLYEMVAGQRPFPGQYDQALLYEIVHEEVAPLTSIRAGVPMELEFIVGKCLAKDRDDRHQAAKEVAVDLRTLAEKLKSGRSTILRTPNLSAGMPASHATQAVALPPGSVVMPRRQLRLFQGLFAAIVLTATALGWMYFTNGPTEPPERPLTRFSWAPEGVTDVTISPDGKQILYAAGPTNAQTLWVRPLASESARELAGTEGVVGAFWSPDSLEIGFGTDSDLKRMALNGGDIAVLCALPSKSYRFFGGSWSPDGQTIVFSSGFALYEVAARGGDPKLLFERGGGPRHDFGLPHFLPAGSGPPGLVYTASVSPSDSWLAVLNLETGERRELGPGSKPVYSAEGYLLHGPQDNGHVGLSALPFSLETLSATGRDFPVERAGRIADVSRNGTLVYVDHAPSGSTTLVWRDRGGDLLERLGQPQLRIETPTLSPDGRRVAVSSAESGKEDIWIQDLVRSTWTRLTLDSRRHTHPSWSPSGRELVYRSAEGAENRLETKPADGSGEAVILAEGGMSYPAWSADGRVLVYGVDHGGQSGIDYLEIQADGAASAPITFLSTPAGEGLPQLSPDGRFLAYVSDESGRNEVYVRPFPSGAGKWQVSVDGGTIPLWRGDGTELFYRNHNVLMAAPVTLQPTFSLGLPQKLFESQDLVQTVSRRSYDVSADGQRFLTIAPSVDENADPPSIRVVQNWYEEFRDREQD